VAGDAAPVVREVPCDGGRAAVIDRPDHGQADLLLIGTGGPARVGAIDMGAELALIQRDHSGDLQAVALFGSSARLVVDGFTFEADVAAEFTRRGTEWVVEGAGRIVSR
jgi:hypothetical protein